MAVVVAAAAVINMLCDNKSRILLQLHITGRCNLRCKHCYRTEGDVEPLSFDDIESVIMQFVDLREKYNKLHGFKKLGHINITGGEPFIRSDIKEILYLLGSHKDKFSYGILSNGSFIDDEVIKILKATNASFVQLSIDGNRETHDELRAHGDYDRVFKTAEFLEHSGITAQISFTANKQNYKHLPTVAGECRKRGIKKLWSDRLVPIGNGEELENLKITEYDMPNYIKTLKRAQGGFLSKALYPKTSVTANRALQFIASKGDIYSCSAGNSLITVDEFGNIMPCRRMPIICGNIFKSTLKDVYFNNEVFKDLRVTKVPDECIACKYALLCNGGAKCQAYAAFNNYYSADPGCFLKDK